VPGQHYPQSLPVGLSICDSLYILDVLLLGLIGLYTVSHPRSYAVTCKLLRFTILLNILFARLTDCALCTHRAVNSLYQGSHPDKLKRLFTSSSSSTVSSTNGSSSTGNAKKHKQADIEVLRSLGNIIILIVCNVLVVCKVLPCFLSCIAWRITKYDGV
jgi:hypothetical protein